MNEFKEYFERYKLWVKSNPLGASKMESAVRLGSYVIAGHFKNSNVVLEIIYSGSKLLEMFNDHILNGKLPSLSAPQIDKLKIMLNVLEYSEVLLEVCANQIWGPTGRWAVISIIQLVKLMWKGFLLFNCKIKLLGSPVLKPVNRHRVGKKIVQKPLIITPPVDDLATSSHVRLERSRRIIRRIGFTPAKNRRTFSPVRAPINDEESHKPSLELHHYIAEGLHILRPITHLGAMYIYGKNSWFPYLLSFGMDSASIHIHTQSSLTKEEHIIVLNRYLRMLIYLIRDPMFGKYTQHVVKNFLTKRGQGRIPIVNSLSLRLLKYIPEWQKTYAYTWS